MGQGEPLNNITNVARAVKQMTSPTAFRLGRSKVGLDLSAKLPREVCSLSPAPARRARASCSCCSGDMSGRGRDSARMLQTGATLRCRWHL